VAAQTRSFASEVSGMPIGSNDLLIAANAYATGAAMVTPNADEFNRIRGLKLENWLRKDWARSGLMLDERWLPAVSFRGPIETSQDRTHLMDRARRPQNRSDPLRTRLHCRSKRRARLLRIRRPW
jgi:hypothetical protein